MPAENEETLTPARALEMRRDALMSIPDEELDAPLTVNAASAADRIESALPKILALRPAIEEELGERAMPVLDELPIITKATQQAVIEQAAAKSFSDMSAEGDELREEHELLLNDAVSLAGHGHLDKSRVELGRPAQGYKMRVTSVLVLVKLFREAWPRLTGKTLLTRERLDTIEAKADDMRRRLNLREGGNDTPDEESLTARALSKLVETYEETRRIVTFVRWHHGDADEIAPSLWARRGRSKKAITEDVTRPTPVTPVTPVTPSPNNGGGPFTS